ncbi:MAG: hypothetical protein RSE54_11310 [Ruthenibacterium sp.]
MLCPKCSTLLAIEKSYQRVEGDKSENTQTKVYTVQELICRNKNCGNFQKVVETAETLIYPIADKTAQA